MKRISDPSLDIEVTMSFPLRSIKSIRIRNVGPDKSVVWDKIELSKQDAEYLRLQLNDLLSDKHGKVPEVSDGR